MSEQTSLARLARLIGDDAHALTFQTFGQYRTALLAAVKLLQGLPGSAPVSLSKAEQEIQAARLARQLEHERAGFPACRDDAYTSGELALEATAYLHSALNNNRAYVPRYFPWDPLHWPVETPRGCLVRAAALCRDELERLDRAAAQVHP
ncbi:hypothetical protein [Pseudomonas fluorescens group sp. PF-69]